MSLHVGAVPPPPLLDPLLLPELEPPEAPLLEVLLVDPPLLLDELLDPEPELLPPPLPVLLELVLLEPELLVDPLLPLLEDEPELDPLDELLPWSCVLPISGGTFEAVPP
jgi:hypothetical protein